MGVEASVVAKAQQQEENHWPGFVDALSTIVMVVTFLLIILAIAIFAMSLNIVKIVVENTPTEKSTTTIQTREVTVDAPETKEVKTGVEAVKAADDRLVLTFKADATTIDEGALGEVAGYFDDNRDKLVGKEIVITSYFDGKSSAYTKKQRIAYYRLLQARKSLMDAGFAASDIAIFVKEAPAKQFIDQVEFFTN
ncbi:MAG: hypothetical protein AAF850_00040 [Pseudomonadota bacterium]